MDDNLRKISKVSPFRLNFYSPQSEVSPEFEENIHFSLATKKEKKKNSEAVIYIYLFF